MTRSNVAIAAALSLGAGLGAEPALALPPGSYLQSCSDMRQDGTLLRGRCRDVKGKFRPTALDVRNCGGPVGNNNGTLACAPAAAPPIANPHAGGPPGGGQRPGGGPGQGRGR